MPESSLFVAPGEHQEFEIDPGVKLQLLHSASSYQVFAIDAAEDARSDAAPHDGEELRYVLSGTVVFTVNGKDYVVAEGGTLRHPSTVPHGFRTGKAPARFVTFGLSRDYKVATQFRGTRGSR